MGPKAPRSAVLTPQEKAIAVACRRYTLLPLDDCLYALQATIPHLTRSALHRLLQRHGISRLPAIDGDQPGKQAFRAYPIGFFHLDIAQVRTGDPGGDRHYVDVGVIDQRVTVGVGLGDTEGLRGFDTGLHAGVATAAREDRSPAARR